MSAELWSYLYVIGAAQGVLLAVALWGRAGHGHSYRILAAWVAILSVHLIVLVLHLRAPLVDPWVLRAYGLARFLPFIYAAFFYVYVHALIHRRKLRLSDWLHALPLVAIVSVNLELVLLPTDSLRALLAFGELPTGFEPWRFRLIDPAMFTCATVYLIAAIRLIVQFRRRVAQQRADADRQGLRWLLVMAGWQLVIWAVALAQAKLAIPGINHWAIYGTVSVWVFVLGYMSLAKAEPLELADVAASRNTDGDHEAGARRQATSGTATETALIESGGKISTAPSAATAVDISSDVEPQIKSAGNAAAPLSSQTANDPGRYGDVLQRLDALMQQDELFRRPALTIAMLAKRSGYPQYLVSEAINRERGGNFYEYVNGWRVEAAKQIIDAAEGHRTLLDIAYDVGFTAKSTFNQAFKRFAGMTPSAYRKAGAAATRTPQG